MLNWKHVYHFKVLRLFYILTSMETASNIDTYSPFLIKFLTITNMPSGSHFQSEKHSGRANAVFPLATFFATSLYSSDYQLSAPFSLSYHSQYSYKSPTHSNKVRCQTKKTILFGNFSQTSDPPPPFGNPLSKKKI